MTLLLPLFGYGISDDTDLRDKWIHAVWARTDNARVRLPFNGKTETFVPT